MSTLSLRSGGKKQLRGKKGYERGVLLCVGLCFLLWNIRTLWHLSSSEELPAATVNWMRDSAKKGMKEKSPSVIKRRKKRKGPIHIHVVMRMYHKKQVHAIGALGTILAAAVEGSPWLRLTVAVLNTGNDRRKNERLAKAMRMAARALAVAADIEVNVDIRPWVPESADTFGYKSTDIELKRVVGLNKSGRPDYVLFCNGDTYYSENVFLAAKPKMEEEVSLIGVNWVQSPRHNNSTDNSTAKFAKTCVFEHGGVDLNGVFLRVEDLRKSGATFATRHTPCPVYDEIHHQRGCRANDTRPFFVADWGIFSILIESGGNTACVDEQIAPMFLQN